MKGFIKGAALLLGGAAVGVLGKTAYDTKGKEIKKVAKDISNKVKNTVQPKPNKKKEK